jgi:fibronectin-binding autotransporter adhesin
MKPNLTNRILIAALAAAGMAGTSAIAASGTWSNTTTGTYSYSTPTNWTSSAVASGASSIMTIASGAGVISATQDVPGLTLGGITKNVSTAGAFTLIGSNSLTVDNGGAGATAIFASNNAGTNANMIDVDLVLTSHLTMQANASAASVWNLGAAAGGRSITGAGNLTFASTVGASSTVNMDINTTGGIFNTQAGGTVTLAGTIGSGVTGITLSGGTLRVSGITPASGTPLTMSAGSTLTLDNTTNASNDRVTGNLVLGASGGFNLIGNGLTSSISESVGTLTLGSGNAVVTLSNTGTGQLVSLASTGFARSGNGTALIRGSSLNTAATNATRVTIDGTNGTGLDFVGADTSSVGTATNGTVRTLRMVPYLIGDTSATGNGSSFLTYDTAAAGGLRPLATNEYRVLTSGYTTPITPENATAFNGTIATSSSVTVNSLRLNAAALALNGSGGALEVNSGTILASSNNTSIGSGFGGLTLGNGTWNEGIITATSGNTLTISTPVSVTGSGGLTKSGAGTLVLAGGTNPYTGATSIHQGSLSISSGTSIAASSGTTIRSGTTLSNSGTVGAVTNSGTFTNNVGGAAGAVTVNTGGTATNNGTISGVVTLSLSTGTTVSNFTNNGTVATSLTIPAGSGPIVSQANAVISGNATLGGGSSTSSGGNIQVDGQLTITGSTAVTLGTISSATTTNQGTGAIYYNNTNVSGNTLNFANGTSLSFFAPGSGSVGTLNTPGTAYVGIYGQTDNVPFDITFGSGTWNIGQVGQNNTGKQTGGTTNIRGGATVNLSNAGAWPSGNNSGATHMHGIYNVGGASAGTFNITSNVSEINGRATTPPAGATNGLQISVDNGGILTVSGTTAIAIATAQTTGQINSIAVNTGGSATLTGAVTLGGNVNNGANIDTNILSVAGGSLAVNNAVTVGNTGTAATGYSNNFNVSSGSATVVNLTMGSASNAASATVSNNVNLSGGKLLVSGGTGITAGAGNNQTNVFNWTAGRLSAFKITPSAKFTDPVSGGITATGLVNSGGTLAPGDVGTAGNTTIAGDYTQQAGGTLAIDIAGTNQTGAFQNTVDPSYDNVLLSGTTANLSLNGNLQVSLVGFTPANSSTFTIIRSSPTALAVSGAFSNVAFGNRITTQGGEGSFIVNNTGTTITLSHYQSNTANDYAAWIGGFRVGGQTAPNDDFDKDNLDNVVENVLGSNPSVYSNGLTQISATASSFKFRHEQSNTIASDVTKTYQWSPDLVNWAASGVSIGGTTATITATTITPADAPLNDVIEVTVTVPPATLTKVFGRLVATKAP